MPVKDHLPNTGQQFLKSSAIGSDLMDHLGQGLEEQGKQAIVGDDKPMAPETGQKKTRLRPIEQMDQDKMQGVGGEGWICLPDQIGRLSDRIGCHLMGDIDHPTRFCHLQAHTFGHGHIGLLDPEIGGQGDNRHGRRRLLSWKIM